MSSHQNSYASVPQRPPLITARCDADAQRLMADGYKVISSFSGPNGMPNHVMIPARIRRRIAKASRAK